ncbi:MAG: HAMP domain-containing histidine kinase [Clostridiales bacterium]|nr:HAMP domain-containing histidine kinase [Clostridiales bacterium]
MFKSIRFKLTLSNALVMLVVILLLAVAIYIFMQGIVYQGLDASLKAGVDWGLLSFVRSSFGPFDAENPLYMSTPPYLRGLEYNLRNADYKLVSFTNPADGDLDPLAALAKNAGEKKRNTTYKNVRVDDSPLRVLSFPISNPGEPVIGVIQVYADATNESFFLSRLLWVLLLISLAAVFCSFAVGWFMAGRALKPVSYAWKRQQELIGDASHELRTPLAVVQANLEVLREEIEEIPEISHSWLDNAFSECKRMGRLLTDLLFLAKTDAGEDRFIFEQINLSGLAGDLVSAMDPLFGEKQIDFISSVQPGLLVLADREKIKQVLVILIDNALKYTPAGGSVSLNVSLKGGKKIISVTDTGLGIALDDQAKIFDRFYRVDKARSRSQGGTGLGLSIAQQIIIQHQGKISVKSTLGEGTSFVVELP